MNHQATNFANTKQQTSLNNASSDALIINSNSSVVSDEVLQQLQEQFGGDNKQIYIFNTNSQQSNSQEPNNSSTNQVQYLILDKNVDINVFLQDPNIVNQLNQSAAQVQQQQQPIPTSNVTNFQESNNIKNKIVYNNNNTQQTRLIQNNNVVNNTNINNTTLSNSQLLVEESIQRVQAPPPKRKQFEMKLENKKNSYQDVFMRYLAGEKQPTLELIAEQASKKPKDNVYYPKSVAQNKLNVASVGINIINPLPNNQTTSSSNNQNNNLGSNLTSNNNTNNVLSLDKENYYNSSRRENLQPLNNYEYRNSYKDHYDNQGVRLNPAILKNLTTPSSSTSSTLTTATGEIVRAVNSSTTTSTTPTALNLQRKKTNEHLASSSSSSPLVISSTQSPLTKSSIVITKSSSSLQNNLNNDTSNNINKQIYSYPSNGACFVFKF